MIKKLPQWGLRSSTNLYSLSILLLLNSQLIFSQVIKNSATDYFFLSEVLIGKTIPANLHFPNIHMQRGISIGIGKDHKNNKEEWAYRLNYPKTGVAIGLGNMGNRDVLGYQFSILPYAEFPLLTLNEKKINLMLGLGSSYFTEKYDLKNNPINKAVSTNITWSFKLFTYYPIFQTSTTNIRLGLGYAHQSNGHKRLPNNGFNSFLTSVNANINFKKIKEIKESPSFFTFEKTQNTYINVEAGWGENTFSPSFNDPKNVFSFRLGIGKKINNTYRLGTGIHYHYYQHYYDYINNNESLVQKGEEFETLKNHPVINASAFGVFITGEMILLNHIGFLTQIGVNLYKPSYSIEWRYNEGWKDTPQEIPEGWLLGDYNSKYKLKKLFSTRLGVKYYFTSIDSNPNHNIYLSASINANLGQADFTEFGLGYIYNLKIN
ncbi:acyloxyacyl hydrolase [Mesonia sp. K4-1]|uniref:acyloxyacyl hydrolase n=1 Tax=Mesonia sp. K4-1 TaxID=2602760 RepID=UPI0011C6F243|nr:acyloxyacyl hydrolase [Mesonia sp. K4-1]TXK77340.1 deacylase [Mesonia sp. K4-1]